MSLVTGRTAAAAELHQLLSESLDDARRRADARAAAIDDTALVLYGAGTLGRAMLDRVRRAGVSPVCFADDTPEKQGSTIDGVPVLAPAEATRLAGRHACVVVTMLNAKLSFLEARRRLRALTSAPVVSFLDLAWKYPAHCLPWYSFERPEEMLRHAETIQHGFGLWADDESRRQFVAHLRFRLCLDHDALPPNSGQSYYPDDVPLQLGPETIFVDGGAYDGDTVRRFLEYQHGRFLQIHAFEPDPANAARLRHQVSLLGEDLAGRIQIRQAGIGARRGEARFDATGDMSATQRADGATSVEIIPLDDIEIPEGGMWYIKLDVEGAEHDALEGARRLLARTRFRLAVSVYHQPHDLWELPAYVDSLGLGCRLYLRTEGEDGMDIVCYAISPEKDGP